MNPEIGAKAIADGKIDAIGVARQFLTDPEWVTKLLENRTQDIKPCICCHSGCFNFSSCKGHANTQDLSDTMGLARCALNPETMQSRKYHLEPAKKLKNDCYHRWRYRWYGGSTRMCKARSQGNII